MKTLSITLTVIISLAVSACSFNLGVKGNGKVITQERNVSEKFTEIRGSAGLDIYLIQGNEYKIEVEADENLQQFIETDITNGKLHITTSENIGWSKAKKIYVTFIEVNTIEASSGADVVGKSMIKSETLSLKSSSGADLEIEVFSKDISAQTSSGAEIKVAGKASSLVAKASSGSELDAKDLMVVSCTAEASSGAEIKLNVKDFLDANASSGADIQYVGNPTSVNANKSSSGSVKKL